MVQHFNARLGTFELAVAVRSNVTGSVQYMSEGVYAEMIQRCNDLARLAQLKNKLEGRTA